MHIQGTIIVLATCGALLASCSSSDSNSVGTEQTAADATPPAGDEAPDNLQSVLEQIQPPDADLIERLSLDTNFYKQHLDADGIPIVASDRVNPYALLEGRWVLQNMLSNRQDVTGAIAQTSTRLAIMAVDEFTTDIPEHSDLSPADYWDRRARGLGATNTRPAVSAGEESILQLPGDPYSTESILVHELAHVIHLQGLNAIDDNFNATLESYYDQAMAEGLWEGTYAATNPREYFAEGVQSWFGTNRENDSEHNDIDTREELVSYDGRLAGLLAEVFAGNQWQYQGPLTRQSDTEHLQGFDRSSAGEFSWPERLLNVDISSGPGIDPDLPTLDNVLTEDWENITSPSTDAAEAVITFSNQTETTVSALWVDFDGNRITYSNLVLEPGTQGWINTFAGHLWEVVSGDESTVIARYRAQAGAYVAIIE